MEVATCRDIRIWEGLICPQGVHSSLKSRITCVHAPYENPHVYILFLLNLRNILTNLIAFKIHFHMYTRVEKKYKNCI